MELGKYYQKGKEIIDTVATNAIAGALHIPTWLASVFKPAINWLLDTLAKPLYDFFERKIVLAPIKKEAEKATEELKQAKTKEEVDRAIDNMP